MNTVMEQVPAVSKATSPNLNQLAFHEVKACAFWPAAEIPSAASSPSSPAKFPARAYCPAHPTSAPLTASFRIKTLDSKLKYLNPKRDGREENNRQHAVILGSKAIGR
jgi:hypothetical protein